MLVVVVGGGRSGGGGGGDEGCDLMHVVCRCVALLLVC